MSRSSLAIKRIAPFIIIALGVLFYSNSFDGVLIMDDQVHIVDNPTLRWQGEPGQNLRGLLRLGRPLVDATLVMNYSISGLEVWSYHALNLIIHILAALTLYGIIRRTLTHIRFEKAHSRTTLEILAQGAALLWMLHPLHTQAVTYIIQRAESLMGLFYFLTLYCAIRGLEGHRKFWYPACVAACALGMASKPVMITAPLMVLLHDRCFFAGTIKSALRSSKGLYAGLAATWGVFALISSQATFDETSGFGIPSFTAWEYFLSQFGVILHYLRLTLWPDALSLDYNWPVARGISRILPSIIIVGALLIASVWAFAARQPQAKSKQAFSMRRPAGFLGLWFFVILAPSSSVFPIKDLAFEHRMYVPLAAAAVLFVFILFRIIRLLNLRRTQVFTGVIVAVFVLALGVRTYSRNRDYKSPVVMWSDVLEKRPNNPRALNELGNAIRDLGNVQEALELYEKALKVEPTNPGPHMNVGNIYSNMGNYEKAIWHFNEALRIDPEYADAHLNIGQTYLSLGDPEKALGHYQKAVNLLPGYAEAYIGLGNALGTLNRFDESMAAFQKASSLKPYLAEPYNNMGTLFYRMERYQEALFYYEEAIKRDPHSAPIHTNLGNLLMKLGRKEEALVHFNRASELGVKASERTVE
ncbi:MAG: tetratricopeptide repeat protein [Candidatus Latescibacteria bacterium]|nr:tetratricopeptide repeat protein [Candidatus Latescibacterota bacterium]NIO56823.1 tetratricopeptide repeat protein [Candidatus Latescibacterota bacterium]